MNIKANFNSLLLFNLTRFNKLKTFFIFTKHAASLYTFAFVFVYPRFIDSISKFASLPSPHTNIHYPAVNFTPIRKAASYLINDLRRKLVLKSQFKVVSPPLLVWFFCKWCRHVGNQRQKNVVRWTFRKSILSMQSGQLKNKHQYRCKILQITLHTTHWSQVIKTSSFLVNAQNRELSILHS